MKLTHGSIKKDLYHRSVCVCWPIYPFDHFHFPVKLTADITGLVQLSFCPTHSSRPSQSFVQTSSSSSQPLTCYSELHPSLFIFFVNVLSNFCLLLPNNNLHYLQTLSLKLVILYYYFVHTHFLLWH